MPIVLPRLPEPAPDETGPYVRQFVADSAQFIDGDMIVQWLVMKSSYPEAK